MAKENVDYLLVRFNKCDELQEAESTTPVNAVIKM